MQRVLTRPFGAMSTGRKVTEFVLTNRNGLQAHILDFGAHLSRFLVPTEPGSAEKIDLVQGFDTAAEWEKNDPYFGATVGRFANRIAEGRFTIGDETHQLALNNEPNGIPCHLHGGKTGFNKHHWDATTSESADSACVLLKYFSPAGEESYPGSVKVEVRYTLNDNDELHWQAKATSDAATPINLCNHTYWNLAGHDSGTVLDHTLQLKAAHYLEVTPGMIPTGEILTVHDTPLDFEREKPLGQDIETAFPTLTDANGYDHCYVLETEGQLKNVATLRDPSSGRTLQVSTDQPGLQLYTANFLDGVRGKGSCHYQKRSSVCLETQNFPDAPNHPAFPNAILHPGELYEHNLVWRLTAS